MKGRSTRTIGQAVGLSFALALAVEAVENPSRGPWLEWRHLTRDYRIGYVLVQTPTGDQYYASSSAVLDPIAFADVVPLTHERGVQITLTSGAARQWHAFTSTHVRESVGLYLDGKIIQGPIVIAMPISGHGVQVTADLDDQIYASLVDAWSAPLDTSLGQREIRVQGLGVVKVDLKQNGERLQLLHNGALYDLPSSFASRPEVRMQDSEITTMNIGERDIVAGDKRFATADEAIEYLKTVTGPKKLALLTVSKPDADTWPKERLNALIPLLQFAGGSNIFVGVRQTMPDGWAWPSTKK